MALALQQGTTETTAEIIAALASAEALPAAVLPLAVERAAAITTAVVEVVEIAARGVFLMPAQGNLPFWGIHAVAAAKRMELYRPSCGW